ncbi:hypothetical protein SK128_025895 [Halocaridina rubra]|uniref:Uncharacterized protein n=1 Tax=Halocaridina rubra TaxID=373956 RepID=A0AAN8WQI5_HALRR
METRRKARLRDLALKQEGILRGENEVQILGKNVQVLSLENGVRSNQLASLPEDIAVTDPQTLSGDSSESRLDHLNLTYDIEVDGEGRRIKKLGKGGGPGKGAWGSETEEGSTEFGGTADGEDTGLTDDNDGKQRRRKGSKSQQKEESNEQVSQGEELKSWFTGISIN